MSTSNSSLTLPTPGSTPTPSTLTSPVGDTSGAWPVGTGALAQTMRGFKLVGDPHATAGDGKKFDDELVGTITQLKSASGDFELQTTQEHPPGHKDVTVNTAAAVKTGDNVVSYDITRHQLVINQKPVTLKPGASQDLPGGGSVRMDAKGKTLTITSAKGDVVNVHIAKTRKGVPLLNIDGSLAASRLDGEVRGALGNFHCADTDSNLDFVGRDGKTYDAKYGTGPDWSAAAGTKYDKAAVAAFEKTWLVPGKSLLVQNQGKGTETKQWLHDASQVPPTAKKSQLSLPSTSASAASGKVVNTPDGPMVSRQGHLISVRIADAFDKLDAAAKAAGIDLQINEGYRSYAEQEKLYQAYLNGTGAVAAKPGTSNHEKGLAIDFVNTPGAYDWLKANASKFGLYNYPPEPWHYSINGS